MSILDKFKQYAAGRTDPASDCFVITPDDNNDLPQRIRGIYFGSDGDIVIVTPKGNTVPFIGVKVGTIIPIDIDRVLATGTNAMDLVGLV